MDFKGVTFRPPPFIGILVGAICAILVLQPGTGIAEESVPFFERAQEVGYETCLGCHDGHASSDKSGIHHLSAGGYDKVSCEDCHGPGSVHSETMDPNDILKMGNYPKIMMMNCLSCHSNMKHGWKAEKMRKAGMNCTDCHKIHQKPVKGNLVKDQLELCSSCHINIKGKMHLPSHHPVGKGRMECSSCHDMTGEEIFHDERANETCLECHAQYRGPYVFEHAPVAENCTVCHDPHGTVADNLMKQNEPFICLSCHQMHFHTQLEGYRGDFTSPLHPDRGGTSYHDSMKRSYLTKCTQCHAEVHGSDLPSQGISGQGKALTR